MAFSGLLKANFLGPQPGQGGTKMRWELTEDLSFTFVSNEKKQKALDSLNLPKLITHSHRNKWTNTTIVVPAGTITDLASIPRPMWMFISPWDVARAAVVHDLLYQTLRKVKDQVDVDAVRNASDIVFLRGMKASTPAIPAWKIQACYQSVRMFGRFVI